MTNDSYDMLLNNISACVRIWVPLKSLWVNQHIWKNKKKITTHQVTISNYTVSSNSFYLSLTSSTLVMLRKNISGPSGRLSSWRCSVTSCDVWPGLNRSRPEAAAKSSPLTAVPPEVWNVNHTVPRVPRERWTVTFTCWEDAHPKRLNYSGSRNRGERSCG